MDRTDHDLDLIDPNLLLRDVVQDLYSTDPTQRTVLLIDNAGYTGPTWRHELLRLIDSTIQDGE